MVNGREAHTAVQSSVDIGLAEVCEIKGLVVPKVKVIYERRKESGGASGCVAGAMVVWVMSEESALFIDLRKERQQGRKTVQHRSS